MSTTFVLMPLSKEFDPVYLHFIKPVLEDAGFDVLRASDIQSAQNIMRDIFEAIIRSDLIVADLTGSNANVFYELGIAHALKRPVILLTQIIDDVPFDLQAYRLVEYNTYFTEIEKAKQTLADYAKKFQEGVLPTRDPLTDFFPDGHLPVSASGDVNRPGDAESGAGSPVNSEPAGFLDSLIATEDHFNAMAEIASRLDGSLKDMTNGLTEATGNLERINANPNQSSARAAQTVCRRLSDKIRAFNDVLEPANIEFAEAVNEAQETVAAVLSFQGENIEATSGQVAEQRESLKALVDAGASALDSLNSMASEFEALPRMERRLDKEVQIGINGLHNTGGSLSRLVLWGSAAVDRMDAMMKRQKRRIPGRPLPPPPSPAESSTQAERSQSYSRA